MNLVFLGIIIFIILAITLSWFARSNTQKISKNIRLLIVIVSILFGIVLVLAGRVLLAAPIFLLLLPLIKLKSGLSLFKALMFFRLLNRLKQQGRFSYTSGTNFYPDSNSINMHAIFYAYGPKFKSGFTIDTFELIHIYPILCELLGIKPYENIDGSLKVLQSILK